ncbi:NBR1-Ig-like domain-containing protein [Pseudomonas citronellolis]|uniref:NBR1-Ig-like domain-containing protein n=1 Tax=Pseudomonas citronellolis TaxID=53408 RepID=UPI0023E4429B|nr:NBR1-Ig-like domain-containing protein [Pseudomonas citronellolis]MDF3937128.1 NBR1-Ig-like domain-containing protein [Pseudomonas citronellolis]
MQPKKAALREIVVRRARELGKSMTAVAVEAELSRSYLYGLMDGVAQDPSVRTLVRLANAIQVSPLLLFRHFADLEGAPLAGASSAPSNRAAGLRDPLDVAVFNADITTPDQTLVLPGEAFSKVWEIQNLGRTPWRGRRLVRVDDEYVMARRVTGSEELQPVLQSHLASLYRQVAIPDTLPGQPVRIAVDFAAPLESCTVASVWRIEDAEGNPCYGPAFLLHVLVTVMAR